MKLYISYLPVRTQEHSQIYSFSETLRRFLHSLWSKISSTATIIIVQNNMAEESRSHFKPNVPESEIIPNNVKKQKTTELSNRKNEDSKNDTKIETGVKHQGGRPSVSSHNKCHLCDKAFKTKGTLGQHLKTHTEDRPYTCIVCGKSFRRKDNLELHSASHSNDHIFECNLCGKTFKHQIYLRRHTKIHFPDRPKCRFCEKSISRRHLKVHERKMHLQSSQLYKNYQSSNKF